MDFVLDAAAGGALLQSLTDRTDEMISDPERFVEQVEGHSLTQLLQDAAALGFTLPLTLRQDDQTL